MGFLDKLFGTRKKQKEKIIAGRKKVSKVSVKSDLKNVMKNEMMLDKKFSKLPVQITTEKRVLGRKKISRKVAKIPREVVKISVEDLKNIMVEEEKINRKISNEFNARFGNDSGKKEVDISKIKSELDHDLHNNDKVSETSPDGAEPIVSKILVKPKAVETPTKNGGVFDINKIKREIQRSLISGNIEEHEAEILEQRAPAKHIADKIRPKKGERIDKFVKTEVPGFDELLEHGIPKGYSVLVAGGAGSGKTILCLQTLFNHASQGKKCFYMSFEESEERLKEHMRGFGWDVDKLVKKGNLMIQRANPFDITRNVDAMLAKQKGELLIDVDPVILPRNFKPDLIAIDSLTAIASAFTGKEESYRIYIEQLFRFFEKLGSTNFLITETKQIPEIFSTTGVEEFLADGVIVFYNYKKGDVREKGVEVLKMRGENHEKKVVAMQINDQGIIVYPEQEVFSSVE